MIDPGEVRLLPRLSHNINPFEADGGGSRMDLRAMQPSPRRFRSGGEEKVSKVVRAFSLDPSVSEDLDYYTRIPGIKKPMNKSRYVNMALMFYMTQNLQQLLEEKEELENQVDKYIRKIQALHDEIKALRAQKGPLYRLWHLLRTPK